MSTPPSVPSCPRCQRRIAAWKMDHCVYCGAPFPPELKEGFSEPEALKWIDRPGLPPEATRQLEMMKVVSFDKKRPRSLLQVVTLLSLPVFAAVFYLSYLLLQRYIPGFATLVLVAGAGVLAYLVWVLAKASKT